MLVSEEKPKYVVFHVFNQLKVKKTEANLTTNLCKIHINKITNHSKGSYYFLLDKHVLEILQERINRLVIRCLADVAEMPVQVILRVEHLL